MQAGTVIHWPKFEYADGGEPTNKYLVILNTPATGEPYIFCKTTSQVENKPAKVVTDAGVIQYQENCLPNKSLFMIPAKKETIFPRNTWLQLWAVDVIEKARLLQAHFLKNVKTMGSISDLTMRQIINCVKASRDIEVEVKKLILQSAKMPTTQKA